MKNNAKMFVVVKSIDLYSFQKNPSEKSQWADLWSYAPPFFAEDIIKLFRVEEEQSI